MASIGFRVDYLVEDGFDRKEPRYVELSFSDLTEEQRKEAMQMEPRSFLKREAFQEELLRHFELNGHHVVPVDFVQGTFTSKVKDDPFYKAEIQITSVSFIPNFEEKMKRQSQLLKDRLRRD